jgi:hypothetical protein
VAEQTEHALVLYRAGRRADAVLRSVRERKALMTVVVLAREENPGNRCCDTRSVLWNRICRELAHEDLSRAASAFDDHAGVAFDVLVTRASDVLGAIEREAFRRGASEIVLADPRASGLGGLERRRLRRRSRLPVRG